MGGIVPLHVEVFHYNGTLEVVFEKIFHAHQHPVFRTFYVNFDQVGLQMMLNNEFIQGNRGNICFVRFVFYKPIFLLKLLDFHSVVFGIQNGKLIEGKYAIFIRNGLIQATCLWQSLQVFAKQSKSVF